MQSLIIFGNLLSKMKEYTLQELENRTCQSFGGNNCVLHGCMFGCTLVEAKKQAIKKQQEQGVKYSKEEIDKILECKKS